MNKNAEKKTGRSVTIWTFDEEQRLVEEVFTKAEYDLIQPLSFPTGKVLSLPKTRLTKNGAPIQEGDSKNLKHILCNMFSNGKECPHKDKCWYAHSVEEQQLHRSKQPCKHMLPDGTCPRPSCKYDHALRGTIPARKQYCRCVQPDGTCKYGKACKFPHLPVSQQMIVQLSDVESDSEDEEEAAMLDDDVRQLVKSESEKFLQTYDISLRVKVNHEADFFEVVQQVQTLVASRFEPDLIVSFHAGAV